MNTPPPTAPIPRRRWLQFSLRTMMLNWLASTMRIRLRFSLRDLLACIAFYAILVVAVHPAGYALVPEIGAFAVGTSFVIGYGLISFTLDRRALRVSYFTCALGNSLAAALALLFCLPPAIPPDWGLTCTLLITGALLLHYFSAIALFAIVSSIAALCCCRRSRAARWLLLANAPNLLIVLCVVIYTVYQAVAAS
ncbi:MAG: hypothetical protein NTY19_07570 [Planctomycetota bacterium]|nr:hypothetical protein [Planctomycetota bacterium]